MLVKNDNSCFGPDCPKRLDCGDDVCFSCGTSRFGFWCAGCSLDIGVGLCGTGGGWLIEVCRDGTQD